MSDRTSDCGVSNNKLVKTEDNNCSSLASQKSKERKKTLKRNSDTKFDCGGVKRESVQILMNQTERDDRSNTLFIANKRFNERTAEPRIHKILTSRVASMLASINAISSIGQRSETSTPSIDQLTEASTSSGVRRSILREKDFPTLNDECKRFSRIKQFWANYSTKETKKSIIFLDQRISNSSLESVVTVIGPSKSLIKSALRSTGSVRSANSSVRFSLPPETPRTNDNVLMKIGNWQIVSDVSSDAITEGWISKWKSLSHTKICKLIMCLAVGLIVPSFLVVPVLVYEENFKEASV